MVNEENVLDALQNVLIQSVNAYLTEGWTQLSSTNVIREFPSVENMPSDVTIFIVPESSQIETLATLSDRVTFNVFLELTCKRDTQANLEAKTYGYYNGIYLALRKSMSLGGVVDFTEVTNAEFFPAVEMNKNVQGMEISLEIQYTKDF